MKCAGIDARTGDPVEISFHQNISSVKKVSAVPDPAIYLAPGWIDLHVNGFAGVDYNDPETNTDEIGRSIAVLFSTGVTRFFPTIITAPAGRMTTALRNMTNARDRLPNGEAIEGFHMEGPHISREDGPRGAHPAAHVRPPDIEEYRRWQDAARGKIAIITISPEWPTAVSYIETVVRDGVVVSIGHTNATSAQIDAAVGAGATTSTHLGNGTHAFLPRHPNYIWEQLAQDRLSATFIADGIHLPSCFLKTAISAKGLSRSILVTDAVTAAASAPGKYKFAGMAVELRADGRVVLAGSTTLAGSGLRMNVGIENLMKFAALSLADSISMATVNPARVVRMEHRMKGLASGERADLAQFRFDAESHRVQLERTFMSGHEVYSSLRRT